MRKWRVQRSLRIILQALTSSILSVNIAAIVCKSFLPDVLAHRARIVLHTRAFNISLSPGRIGRQVCLGTTTISRICRSATAISARHSVSESLQILYSLRRSPLENQRKIGALLRRGQTISRWHSDVLAGKWEGSGRAEAFRAWRVSVSPRSKSPISD